MKRFAGLFLGLVLFVASLAALDSPRPVILLDSHNQPWAAWVERHGRISEGHVSRWDGSTWVSLGGPLNRAADQSIASVSLAFAPDGTAWAAWGEHPLDLVGPDVGLGLLHVAKWNGQTWEEPAPSASQSTRTIAERPQVKVDSHGVPWVVWSEITPDFNVDNVYLAVLKDKAWVLVDNGTLTTDVSSSSRTLDLAFGPEDEPWLAYSKMIYHHDFQVFAGPWDGRQWAPVGGELNLNPEAYAAFPSLVVDAKGVPTVAFLQASGGFKLVVKRWNGSRWDVLGTPGSLGARSPKVELSLGQAPVVADIEPRLGITVRQRSNAGWVDLGNGISKPGAFVDTVDLAVDSAGDPWVIWAEDDERGQRLGLAKWSVDRWQLLSPPPFAPR